MVRVIYHLACSDDQWNMKTTHSVGFLDGQHTRVVNHRFLLTSHGDTETLSAMSSVQYFRVLTFFQSTDSFCFSCSFSPWPRGSVCVFFPAAKLRARKTLSNPPTKHDVSKIAIFGQPPSVGFPGRRSSRQRRCRRNRDRRPRHNDRNDTYRPYWNKNKRKSHIPRSSRLRLSRSHTLW